MIDKCVQEELGDFDPEEIASPMRLAHKPKLAIVNRVTHVFVEKAACCC